MNKAIIAMGAMLFFIIYLWSEFLGYPPRVAIRLWKRKRRMRLMRVYGFGPRPRPLL